MQAPLRIGELMTRPVFRGACLAAGSAGVGRAVRWVHIVDLAEPRPFIRGGELVLTTGAGFRGHEHGFLSYVQGLIDGGAAGLCIELGTSLDAVSSAVLRLANAHDFPLITFSFQVHFVDITQDVHGLILSRHHKWLDDLEVISRRLAQCTVQSAGTQQILDLLHEVSGCAVVYARAGAKSVVVGPPSTAVERVRAWLETSVVDEDLSLQPQISTLPVAVTPDAADREEMSSDVRMITQPVVVQGMARAILGVVSEHADVNEYLSLVVDRAVTALAQEEFRKLSMQERQLFYEQDWVEQVIRAHASTEPGASFGSSGPQVSGGHYCALVIATPPPHSEESETADLAYADSWFERKTDLAMLTRLAFGRQRMRTYLSVRHDAIVAIVEVDKVRTDARNRIAAALEPLRQAPFQQAGQPLRAGVGREVASTAQLHRSYEEAWTTLRMHAAMAGDGPLFYADIGIYRWLALLGQDAHAYQLATEELSAVIEHDRRYRSNLLETLKVYLDCDRSKQQTADKLFIHRQTLYHRLEQLEQLLGDGFGDPHQRLATHLAVYLHALGRVERGEPTSEK